MKRIVIKSNSDGQYYFQEDLEWGIVADTPDSHGFIVPKKDAKPVYLNEIVQEMEIEVKESL